MSGQKLFIKNIFSPKLSKDFFTSFNHKLMTQNISKKDLSWIKKYIFNAFKGSINKKEIEKIEIIGKGEIHYYAFGPSHLFSKNYIYEIIPLAIEFPELGKINLVNLTNGEIKQHSYE
jgi:hypothetical protein